MLLSILLLVYSLGTSAQEVINLTDSMPATLIGTSLAYFIDTSGNMQLADVQQAHANQLFKPSTQQVPNFGNVEVTVWNKFTVVNNSSKTWLLTNLNDTDSLNFFFRDSMGVYREIVAGASLPASLRKYYTNVFAFDLPVQRGDTSTYYLRVETRSPEYALSVTTYEDFVKSQFSGLLGQGIYFGIAILIIIYNIVMFLSFKDRTYLYYLVYVFFTALLMAVLCGIYPFLLQDRLHFLWNAGPIITALGGVFLFLFSKSFLRLEELAPRVSMAVGRVFLPLFAISILLTLFGKAMMASVLNQVVGLLGLLSISGTAVYVYVKGFKAARFYILACSFYFVGVFIYVLKAFGLLPYNFITSNSMEIGSALEMILFTVSMGDRINITLREKVKAKSELIKSFKEQARIQHEKLELEAMALRSQMNPHFIFNCLNSIKSLIQKKDDINATRYLTTFAKLMRSILQNSDKRQVSLFDEVETCKLYTELEKLRFGSKFTYEFLLDPTIDSKSVEVPALIIQPFIENAVWHGIMPKEEGGHVQVNIERRDGAICCIIDDDGIGRAKSGKHQFNPNSSHVSKGVSLTQSRLMLDSELNDRHARARVIDKVDMQGEPAGTRIILTFKEYPHD